MHPCSGRRAIFCTRRQEAAPFGANVGGVNPLLVSASPAAAFDSWLTVGVTDGDSAGRLSSIGIDWTAWTISEKDAKLAQKLGQLQPFMAVFL